MTSHTNTQHQTICAIGSKIVKSFYYYYFSINTGWARAYSSLHRSGLGRLVMARFRPGPGLCLEFGTRSRPGYCEAQPSPAQAKHPKRKRLKWPNQKRHPKARPAKQRKKGHPQAGSAKKATGRANLRKTP